MSKKQVRKNQKFPSLYGPAAKGQRTGRKPALDGYASPNSERPKPGLPTLKFLTRPLALGSEGMSAHQYHSHECPTCGDPRVEALGGEKDWDAATEEEWKAAPAFQCMICGQLYSAHEDNGVVVRTPIEEGER